MLGEFTNGRKHKEYVLQNGHLLNFTRPEKSPILQFIEDEDQKAAALSYLNEAAELLKNRPREDQTNSEDAHSDYDQHFESRLTATAIEAKKSIEAIQSGKKYYQFK